MISLETSVCLQYSTPIFAAAQKMIQKIASLCAFFAVCLIPLPAKADPVNLILLGNGGFGLRADNISPLPANAGSGGSAAGGITLDPDTGTLLINILWGSGNGFTDMSGPVTNLHLHGPTASNRPDSYSETSSNIIVNLGMHRTSIRHRRAAA